MTEMRRTAVAGEASVGHAVARQRRPFLTSATLVGPGVAFGANRPAFVQQVARRGYAADLVSGLRYVRHTKVTLSMILIATGANFFNLP